MAFSIYIEYTPMPGKEMALLERLRADCEECIRDDEGCLRMELAQPDPADGRLVLSELWRDRDALEAHKNKPGHSHAWQDGLLQGKRVLSCQVLLSPVKPGARD
jgi:quinol monooxygenase YgiN